MNTITQTNRTILFEEINPEKLNLLTLVGDVRGVNSVSDDKIKEIKKLIGELGKIGSNLNQIARYFNQGGIISSEMRKEIKKSLRDIYEMKYEVMRMAGDFRGSD